MSFFVGNPADTLSIDESLFCNTVKFLNFGTPEIFAKRVFCQNGANGIANSQDPDQIAPLGAV